MPNKPAPAMLSLTALLDAGHQIAYDETVWLTKQGDAFYVNVRGQENLDLCTRSDTEAALHYLQCVDAYREVKATVEPLMMRRRPRRRLTRDDEP